MKKPSLTVTSDFTKDFNDIIKKFKNDAIRVGIPQEENTREEDPIGNAAILAINEFGSPTNNVAAWPVMSIGIRNAQDEIAEQLKNAATKALTQGFNAVEAYYNRAGIIASNSIKKVINAQEGLPDGRPMDSTLAARKSKGFLGTKAMIVTGQVRNAITYVINKGGF